MIDPADRPEIEQLIEQRLEPFRQLITQLQGRVAADQGDFLAQMPAAVAQNAESQVTVNLTTPIPTTVQTITVFGGLADLGTGFAAQFSWRYELLATGANWDRVRITFRNNGPNNGQTQLRFWVRRS